MLSSVSQIRVRYAETDKMNVAYHGNYFTWFEVARVEMFDQLGAPYAGFEAEGFLLPVLSATAKFIAPARFDDRLTVTVFMRERPRAKMSLDYRVEREGILLATGETTHGFMTPEGRGVRPPERFTALVEAAWAARREA